MPAAGYAAERGVTLVLENEALDALATVAGMLRILEAEVEGQVHNELMLAVRLGVGIYPLGG